MEEKNFWNLLKPGEKGAIVGLLVGVLFLLFGWKFLVFLLFPVLGYVLGRMLEGT